MVDSVVHERLNRCIRQNSNAKLPKCLKYGNIYCFIFCTGKANYLLSYILGGDRSVHVYLDTFCSERISTVENNS